MLRDHSGQNDHRFWSPEGWGPFAEAWGITGLQRSRVAFAGMGSAVQALPDGCVVDPVWIPFASAFVRFWNQKESLVLICELFLPALYSGDSPDSPESSQLEKA